MDKKPPQSQRDVREDASHEGCREKFRSVCVRLGESRADAGCDREMAPGDSPNDGERAEQKNRYELLCVRFCLLNITLYPNRLLWTRIVSKSDEQF